MFSSSTSATGPHVNILIVLLSWVSSCYRGCRGFSFPSCSSSSTTTLPTGPSTSRTHTDRPVVLGVVLDRPRVGPGAHLARHSHDVDRHHATRWKSNKLPQKVSVLFSSLVIAVRVRFASNSLAVWFRSVLGALVINIIRDSSCSVRF